MFPASLMSLVLLTAYGSVPSHHQRLRKTEFVLTVGPRRVCMPLDLVNHLENHTNANQLVAVVTKWLEGLPSHWHEPASGLIAVALAKAYPCQK